jgi:hypothetical protein
MDVTALTPDDLGPGTDNPARVQEVLDRAAGLSASTPVLMLPVRLETRFVQVERPGEGPQLLELAEAIGAAAIPFEELGARDLLTELTGTVKEKREFKRDTEEKLYAFVGAQLEAAAGALGSVADLVHALPEGGSRDQQVVADALGRLEAAVAAARGSLARLRSPYQRAQFLARFEAVATQAADVASAVRDRVLPSAALTGGLRRTAGVSRVRLADSAEAHRGARSLLESLATAVAQPPPSGSRLVPESVGVAEEAIATAERVSALAESMAVLPGYCKQELAATGS